MKEIVTVKYPLALGLWLLSASAAAAENYLVPPPEYDHPFNGKVIETIVTDRQKMNDTYCVGNVRPLACASLHARDGLCFIYILSEELMKPSGITVAQARRHEIAHCNGWKHPKAQTALSKEDAERLWSLKKGESYIIKPLYNVPDVRHCHTPECYEEEWKKANP